jgi:hypothetical protein
MESPAVLNRKILHLKCCSASNHALRPSIERNVPQGIQSIEKEDRQPQAEEKWHCIMRFQAK